MRTLWMAVAILALHASAPAAFAVTIQLSDFSSDETPPEFLSASLDFSVAGDLLTLVVSNETSDPPAAFEISEVGFNATEEVSDLQLLSGPDAWTLMFSQRPGNMNGMDGFGRFDAHLEWGGGQSATILPGEMAFFTFQVTGVGFSEFSFVTDLASTPPGNNPMLIAGRFIRGPNADSAFGATDVPEPATILLLGVGVFAAVRRNRRG